MELKKVHVFKFVELILVIVCLGLHYKSGENAKLIETMIIDTAFGGYIIILIAVLVGLFTNEPISSKIDIFFTLVGCIIFIAAGAFAIQFFDNYYLSTEIKNIGIAKGSIAIINGVIFLVDAIFTFREQF